MADELSMTTEKVLRVVEFYSGIGGMHFAIKGCGVKVMVVGAFEINTTANVVYKHNFPDVNLMQRNIEGLTAKDLDLLAPDVFLMSPPCQPFTRVGLKGDSNDPRTKSFLHIMDLILRMSSPPNYILMENVKGFETSLTREQFIGTLDKTGYSFQEFLISPNQLGIPNSRLRYYMLAKRKPYQFYFETQQKIMTYIPECDKIPQKHCTNSNTSTSSLKSIKSLPENAKCTASTYGKCIAVGKSTASSSNNTQNFTNSVQQIILNSDNLTSGVYLLNGEERTAEIDNIISTYDLDLKCSNCVTEQRTLGEFLEPENAEYFQPYLLPDKVLSRFALVLDIVSSCSSHSCCFTKAYGHYAEGTGSILKMADIDDTEHFAKYRSQDSTNSDCQRAGILRDLKLRYFTPREVANIMCFPKSFGFPKETTLKQKYRLLGNSLNVHVVTELLKCLLNDS